MLTYWKNYKYDDTNLVIMSVHRCPLIADYKKKVLIIWILYIILC